jgi:hypothetical protein
MNMHVSEFVQGPNGDSCHNMAEPTEARTCFSKAVGMEQLIRIDSVSILRAYDSTEAAGWY